MFSIIFTVFYYKLVHKAERITVNGFIVIAPLIADCFIISRAIDVFK